MTSDFDKIVLDNLKQLMKEREWIQKDLINATGIPQQSMSALLLGNLPFSNEYIYKIVQGLRIKTEQLVMPAATVAITDSPNANYQNNSTQVINDKEISNDLIKAKNEIIASKDEIIISKNQIIEVKDKREFELLEKLKRKDTKIIYLKA